MIVYFDFIRQVQKNAYIEWDIKTITAGDYSVEFDLPEGFYDKWMKMHYGNHDTRPPAEIFKEWMTDEMEYVLTQLPDLGYEDEPVEQVKIGVTTFAFNNEEVIHLLRERGQIIK